MEKYIPTGNEMISLPKINEATAAIEDFTFLSMQHKGMIEVCGGKELPLMVPFVSINGERITLSDFRWKRQLYWIPQLNAKAGQHELSLTILTPIKERGFAVKLSVTGADHQEITWGLHGCWESSWHCVNEDKRLEGTVHCYRSGWNSSLIFDFRSGGPVFAFAPMSDKPTEAEFTANGQEVHYTLSRKECLRKGETTELVFYWGLGFEEVAAATSAKEMLRRGWDWEYERTSAWLAAHIQQMQTEKLTEIYNTNLFFCIFYSTGRTLDTEELICATSRGTRYYVSAAYWDRDVLLWAFPTILDASPELAEEILHYVFGRQGRNIGVHSRYIDGTVLEPGFELDELMSPILALDAYVTCTGDNHILDDGAIVQGIKRILSVLDSMRHPEIALYETFLQPTDDEIVYPYLTYDNVLVWKSMLALAERYPDQYSSLAETAAEVRNAIDTHCVFESTDGKRYFSWSVDLKGNHNIYDEPPGSLQLLPYYGFCPKDDEVWLNTVKMIRSPDYKLSFSGSPIAEIGCAHAPYPWVLSLCNSLLSGYAEQGLRELEIMKMDNGIACESVDPVAGTCMTGAAFATCAGFLCHSMKIAKEGFDA